VGQSGGTISSHTNFYFGLGYKVAEFLFLFRFFLISFLVVGVRSQSKREGGGGGRVLVKQTSN
jgi:hypothetical protein